MQQLSVTKRLWYPVFCWLCLQALAQLAIAIPSVDSLLSDSMTLLLKACRSKLSWFLGPEASCLSQLDHSVMICPHLFMHPMHVSTDAFDTGLLATIVAGYAVDFCWQQSPYRSCHALGGVCTQTPMHVNDTFHEPVAVRLCWISSCYGTMECWRVFTLTAQLATFLARHTDFRFVYMVCLGIFCIY